MKASSIDARRRWVVPIDAVGPEDAPTVGGIRPPVVQAADAVVLDPTGVQERAAVRALWSALF